MSRDPNTPPPIPTTPQQPPPIPVMGYAGPSRPCPGCGGGPIAEPSFTWWGGLVGHKLLNVERCKSCRRWWVKGTARPGGTRVMIYMIAGIVLGLIVGTLVVVVGRR